MNAEPQTSRTVRLIREFTFEAAHCLPNAPEEHKCRRLHGHRLRVGIVCEGEIDSHTGWLVDSPLCWNGSIIII